MAKSVLLYWGMGLYWGHAVSQNAKGHLIGHVKVGQQLSPTSCHCLLLWVSPKTHHCFEVKMSHFISGAIKCAWSCAGK